MIGRRDTTSEGPGATFHRDARGGVSGGAILTGVVVAFGAMFILTALIGAALATVGVSQADISTGEAIDAGIGAGMALVLAQFLSYLWGGYGAGRMGRGAGPVNGLLVPIVAILVAVVVGAIAAAFGEAANLNLPFTTNRLPLENDFLVNWGVGIGIASLVAMFLGGLVGGSLGARWHTKLERRAHDEHDTVTDRGVTAPAAGARGATGSGGTGPGHTAVDLRDDTTEGHRTTPLRH